MCGCGGGVRFVGGEIWGDNALACAIEVGSKGHRCFVGLDLDCVEVGVDLAVTDLGAGRLGCGGAEYLCVFG
jgi:hypothetical protein